MRTVKLVLLLVVFSVVPALSTLGQDNGLPFKHTTCANGIDLTGQTIIFPQIMNQSSHVDLLVNPLKAGYADANRYFNEHGGICGATIQSVFSTEEMADDTMAQYQSFAALNPRPVMVALYSSGDAEDLSSLLAGDKIAALNLRGGSTASAYGTDGQTLGWVFAANPIYVDQVGAMCDYIAANPQRFPKPVLGFLNQDDDWAIAAAAQARGYCTTLGIGDAGAVVLSEGPVNSPLQKLVDAGANII